MNDLIIALKTAVTESTETCDKAVDIMVEALRNGKKILMCGNGGSAATVSHIVNDLSCHMKNWNRKGYRVISLCESSSILTSLTNDYSFEEVFSKQLEALGETDDVLWAFSSSGNSKNVICAMNMAKNMGIQCIALTGQNGGTMKDIADVWIGVPSDETMRVEELHLIYAHCISETVESIVSPMEIS